MSVQDLVVAVVAGVAVVVVRQESETPVSLVACY